MTFGEFKKLYKKAADKKAEMFEVNGAVLLTDYAKYLIEYLEHIQHFPEEMEIDLRPKKEV